jgi:hypothetical protein
MQKVGGSIPPGSTIPGNSITRLPSHVPIV